MNYILKNIKSKFFRGGVKFALSFSFALLPYFAFAEAYNIKNARVENGIVHIPASGNWSVDINSVLKIHSSLSIRKEQMSAPMLRTIYKTNFNLIYSI